MALVVYDACVLYRPPLRDLLVRVARMGVVQARWSERILDECTRSITTNRPDIPGESLMRMWDLMPLALPGATVAGYEPLAEGIDSPTRLTSTSSLSRSRRTRRRSSPSTWPTFQRAVLSGYKQGRGREATSTLSELSGAFDAPQSC